MPHKSCTNLIRYILSEATMYHEQSGANIHALVSKRLVKWRHPESKWSKAWRNQSKPIEWNEGSRDIVKQHISP